METQNKTKKTIDYTFQEVECTQTNEATALHFSIDTESFS